MNNQALFHAHFEMQVEIDAPPAEVFALLDDHRRLSAHMTEPSWMVAGSHMTIDIDEKQGRTVGSKITLSGRSLGLPLLVEEVVRELRVVDSKNRIIGIVSDITDYGAGSVPFYHPVVFQNKTTLVEYYLTFYRDEVFAYHSAYYTEADCTGQAMAFMPDRDSSMVHNAAFGKPGKTIMVPIPGAPLYKGTVVSSWDPYTQECDNFDPYPPEDETEHTWMSPLTPVGNFDDWYTKPYAPN